MQSSAILSAILLIFAFSTLSKQDDSFRTDDLSFAYLKWKFDQNHSSAHNDSKIYENCDAFIFEFSKQASRFIECSIDNARPFRFCEGCVVHYEKAKTVYNDIKQVDKKMDICKKSLLDSDRVQVINSVYSDFEDIWNSADCNRCFVSNSITETENGTVKFTLRETTIAFHDLYNNFTHCIGNISAIKPNNTKCKDCATYYNQMNTMFDKLLNDKDSPQHVCMDIVDMMNYTRLLWGDTLNCTKFRKEYGSVISIGIVLLLIPPLFYICMKVYGTKKEKEIIRQKRLSIYNQDNSFSYTVTTVTASPETEASHENSVNHTPNLTDGPIRKRPNPTQDASTSVSVNERVS